MLFCINAFEYLLGSYGIKNSDLFGYLLTGLFEHHRRLEWGKNLSYPCWIFMGCGPQIKFVDNNIAQSNTKFNFGNNFLIFSIDAIIGFELRTRDPNFTITIDEKPSYDIGNYSSDDKENIQENLQSPVLRHFGTHLSYHWGVTARYIFKKH